MALHVSSGKHPVSFECEGHGSGGLLAAIVLSSRNAAEGLPDRSRTTTGLNPENPNRNNRPKHGQAGDCPARDVDRTIRFRSIDHRVVPVGHDSLREIASVGRSPPAAQGSNPWQRRDPFGQADVAFDPASGPSLLI